MNKEQLSNQPTKQTPHLKWNEVDVAKTDIKNTFGFVPSFINNYPDSILPGAWEEAKVTRFSPNTALDLKLKGLIALSVASQIPCNRIEYFEERATQADGATRQEQLEAILMSANTRRWSTVLNGSQIDKNEFKKEADKIMSYVKKMMEDLGGNLPDEEMFLVSPKSAEEAYTDIEKTLGLVPKFMQLFPRDAIAGAWSEFKALQLNPYTALSGREKELIGVAVASQIPCDYCIYFHKLAAKLNKATDTELNEAIAVGGCARHWSAVFHGPSIDSETFKKDADQMLQSYKQRQQLQ